MRIRPKAVVGIFAGLVLVVLSAVPVSANTMDIVDMSGEIVVVDWTNDSPLITIPLEACYDSGTATATASTSTTGTFTATVEHVSELVNPFGDSADYVMELTATITADYIFSGSLIYINEVSITATIRAMVFDDCDPIGVVLCTVEAIGFGGGTWNSVTLPTMDVFDTVHLTAENSAFMTTANDMTTPGCGGFGQMNSNILKIDASIVVW